MAASLPQKTGMTGMPTQQQPTHMPPSGSLAAGQQAMPPQGALREISPVFLCRIGQETVQDIVTRTMEIFQITRATQVRKKKTKPSRPFLEIRLTLFPKFFRRYSVLIPHELETVYLDVYISGLYYYSCFNLRGVSKRQTNLCDNIFCGQLTLGLVKRTITRLSVLISVSASQWRDSEPGNVPRPLWKTPGTLEAARPALPQTSPAVRTLRGDDRWPAGGAGGGRRNELYDTSTCVCYLVVAYCAQREALYAVHVYFLRSCPMLEKSWSMSEWSLVVLQSTRSEKKSLR